MSIGNGIKLSAGFDLNVQGPLDNRTVFKTIVERNSLPEINKYNGLKCYVEETDRYYRNVNNQWVEDFISTLTFQTLDEFRLFDTTSTSPGTECFVVENKSNYMYIGEGHWRASSSNAVYIGGEAPIDTTAIWVNDIDEDCSEVLNPDELEIFRKAIKAVDDKVDPVAYAIKYELDPGYFGGVLPGSDPSLKPELPPGAPDLGDGAEGTCGKVYVKRGLKKDLKELGQGEFGFCLDTEELYIGNRGMLKLLAKVGGISSDSGSDNVNAEYIEFISKNGKKYRLSVNEDGALKILPSTCFTDKDPALSDSGRYKGLIINQIYGGGSKDSNIPCVSHGFIELYNNTAQEFNLKGLSVQYAEYLGKWQVLKLIGTVKPYHSFLIRCSQHTDINRPSTRLKVKDYDMHWEIPLSDAGMKVMLTVGTDPCTYVNPANTDGVWTPSEGYIDMIGAGGADTTRVIDGYEKAYLHCMDKNTGIHRKDFKDTENNSIDCEPLNYNKVDVEIYGPRCTKTGQWNHYYNKVKMDRYIPTVINIAFGKDGSTERTFTWQTTPTRYGYLKYKKVGDSNWIKITSNKKLIQHQDTDVTSHSVIIKNLTPGEYVYMAGEEGAWSDEYTISVKNPTKADPINFIHITDQQGWTEEEYTAWEKANDYIHKNDNYDFIINTGDISQNGNRRYEWQYYFEMAKDNLQSHVHVCCCGNNDLIDKKDPTAYTYYSTNPESFMPSVYSFNYGYIHFICCNSNVEFKEEWSVSKQIEWIKADAAKPENQKRWTIAYMHESPYTIVNTARVQPFIEAFHEIGVDLCLCGHHHCYSRSLPMASRTPEGADVVDEATGVYYVMSQATGYKLSGKQKPVDGSPWFGYIDRNGDPCYIKWEVTWDEIKMHPYRLTQIMPLIDNAGKPVKPVPFDTGLVIPNRKPHITEV